MVRAKFRCLEVTRRYSHTDTDRVDHFHYKVKLAPVLSNKNHTACEENRTFYAATPAGECVMEVVSEGAAAFFQPGKAYYLDFQEADE